MYPLLYFRDHFTEFAELRSKTTFYLESMRGSVNSMIFFKVSGCLLEMQSPALPVPAQVVKLFRFIIKVTEVFWNHQRTISLRRLCGHGVFRISCPRHQLSKCHVNKLMYHKHVQSCQLYVYRCLGTKLPNFGNRFLGKSKAKNLAVNFF